MSTAEYGPCLWLSMARACSASRRCVPLPHVTEHAPHDAARYRHVGSAEFGTKYHACVGELLSIIIEYINYYQLLSFSLIIINWARNTVPVCVCVCYY